MSPGFFTKRKDYMFKLSLNRIHDTVKITEGQDHLVLKVNGEPRRMVAGLSQAQKMLTAIGDDSTEEEVRKAAEFFSGVIFGTEQAAKLMEFYRNDCGCVINVCGRYFAERLKGLIIKAQKNEK